jgi:hypothetical protein
MALVLEEVQVPVVLGDGVVDRMHALVPGHRKASAGGEVDQHRQPLGRSIELDRLHGPGRADAQR